MAESHVRAWLSTADNQWRDGPPKSERSGDYNVPLGNVEAVRVEGPDPDGAGSRWYTIMGPLPWDIEDLEDGIDAWIEDNYGEFS